MTARPSPAAALLGYASCEQYDQRGRCTVAHFNWVPNYVGGPSKTNSDVTIQAEMYTALHEMLHVLGFMGPGATVASSPFLDPVTGAHRTTGVYAVEPDPAFGGMKVRTVMTTPRVVNFTRTYLNCTTATGFPLEDLPLGKGVHWESRVAGPELMSYGLNSGQVYLSDLTLGFLEDTNQYIVDYSVAGLIHNTSTQDDYRSLTFLASKNAGDSAYVPPPPPPPGRLRWAFNEGCSFLNGHPRGWPADHTCAKTGLLTCTPDGFMAATCYASAAYGFTNYESYGGYDQTSGVGAQLTSGPNVGLPSWLAFYQSDAAAAAAVGAASAAATSVGGYQASMDYVPVPVGYWSCIYADASSQNSSQAGDTGSAVSQALGYVQAQLDTSGIGGQARCPSCRCTQTRLSAPATYALTLKLPDIGGCYRMNCYKPDYLQIAVLGATAGITSSYSFWYSCPASGGKLFIPGFIGSLTCPPAVAFCAKQEVTGVLYPEQNLYR